MAPPVQSPDPLPRFYFDYPTDWSRLPQCLLIRAWCFTAGGKPIRSARLRAGNITLAGLMRVWRPDVRAAMPEAPDDYTGFEIRGTLQPGRTTVIIEAESDGTWHPLLTHDVIVEQRILPLWLAGGTWKDLIFSQFPAHMAYDARPVRLEKFPRSRPSPHRPRFAIVTPSYQQARYLGETMASVLAQSGVKLEYVVQDGGSTDGSVALIQHHAPQLHAWESARDGGQADAIARGFAKTSGGPHDVMAWINSDDYYLPGALAFVADYFAKHPDVDVLYGHRIVVNEESKEIARWFLPRHDNEILRLNDFVPQETMFWRRRVWDRVGGLDTTFKFAMDWDLLLRFAAAGAKIVHVPWFLACFRVHPAQKTSADMEAVGQPEITLLRERAQGRVFPAPELESHARLLRFLRRSAWIQFLWRWGIRSA